MNQPDFQKFPKIPRLMRDCVITEKIDGANGIVWVDSTSVDGPLILAGSRNRWLTVEQDSFGFARWVDENAEDLITNLGDGYHFGEWWGQGIQRRYNMCTKEFSLFNVHRWGAKEDRPLCCGVVPVLHDGVFTTDVVEFTLDRLQWMGSHAAPGFMSPEGIVIWHSHSRTLFKYTLGDDGHKETK